MAESQETSDYPGTLDTWVTVTDKEDLVEQSDINKIKAAVTAVQTELGTDPAGTVATLKLRLAAALAGNGAIANGTAFPTSPTPVDGQIFYRTDENTVYVYNGSAWESVAMAHAQIFTSSNTFTAPGGVTKVYLSMVGGGGGGAGSTSGTRGGGGGGGGMTINYPYTVIPGNNYTVTIGTGGTAGASNGGAAGNGASTSFDSAVIAVGGTGGTMGAGGLGGGTLDATSNSGGTHNLKGGNGSTTGSTVAGGGGTLFGSGNSMDTAPTANTGGGGGGADTANPSGKAGQVGSSGICIVMY